ncbi:Rad2 nuclease, partial [Spiromyces aspiralis]
MNVTPYMVFDGGKLPSKEHTELERSARRKRNLEEGLRQWRESNRKAANDYFQRCLEVTPEMTKCIIEELKREGVEYLVAPYEADAQLAYLERQGIISAVITEDSDLLPYGFKHVFFKMDQWGNGTLFDRSLLPEVKGVSLRGWTDDRFRQLCILSGCDYLASVPGIGLKKAYKYMAKTRDIATVIRTMRMNGLQVPVDYYEGFQRADLTFLYQRVYDPINKQLATVSPLPEGMNADNMPYVGRYLEPKIARGIAEGDLDPITLGPLRVNNRFPQIALRPGMVFYPGSKPTQQGVINDLASAFRKKAKSVEPFIETGTTSPFFNHSQPV